MIAALKLFRRNQIRSEICNPQYLLGHFIILDDTFLLKKKEIQVLLLGLQLPYHTNLWSLTPTSQWICVNFHHIRSNYMDWCRHHLATSCTCRKVCSPPPPCGMDMWLEHTCHSYRSLSTAYSESCTLWLEQGSRSLADTQNVVDLWCWVGRGG